MSSEAVNDSIAQMQQAQADNARLMTASMTANTAIQGMAATAHTVNGASAAGGEVAKAVGNNVKDAAKAN
jgi:hypothetical protein